MSGKLYADLFRYSGKASDKKEALDIFNRVINRFPKSAYRDKATSQIKSLSKIKSSKKVIRKKTKKKSSYIAERKFVSARSSYNDLLRNSKKKKYRSNWISCANKFKAVYTYDPTGPWAAAGLYMSGKLSSRLYKYSRKSADKKNAIETFEKVIHDFPKSRYREKAAKDLQRLSPKSAKKSTTIQDIIKKKERNTSQKTTVKKHYGHSTKGVATVEGLRYWSNPSYTRVVIDADKETSYSYNLLDKDRAKNKPQRLYVDLKKSRLGDNIKNLIPINDNLLKNARAGQFTDDSVRIVIDIKSFKNYKIFSLKNPFRIVIDVWGKSAGSNQYAKKSQQKSHADKISKGALAKQFALGVKRIVIDPGHGGRDYGAPGYLKGVHEKDVALQLARKLAEKIRTQLNCEVILTRRYDKFLTLEERTAIANTKNADLFISIHLNASRNRKAYGIETYFLNLATNDDEIRVAARENATSRKNISDLHTILSDLMQNAKIHESSRLAGFVQSSMCSDLKRKYSRIKNKGVKKAPFYVLLGAQMPAILIETSFISNPRECKRLVNKTYQDRVCNAIVKGIKRYIKETSPDSL